MKKMFLGAALVILLSTAVQAQVTFEYQRERRNSNLIITYNSGGYGYGYPSGYSWGGYGGYCGGGMNYGGWGYPGTGGITGFGSSYYSFGNGSYLYSGPYYGGNGYSGGYGLYRGYGRPAASTDAAGPLPRSGPVADRLPEFASAREIEEGRRRLKLADYRGAVDQFRLAVASHTENPLAQAWFAVALAISGDGRNADKALRAAAGAGLPADRMDLSGGLRDDREHTRLVGVLSKVVGEGSLAAAFTLSLTGDPAKLKQLAEKDPVARRLLPKP